MDLQSRISGENHNKRAQLSSTIVTLRRICDQVLQNDLVLGEAHAWRTLSRTGCRGVYSRGLGAKGARRPVRVVCVADGEQVLTGVSDFPSRVKCASLAWHTLKSALNEEEEQVTTE